MKPGRKSIGKYPKVKLNITIDAKLKAKLSRKTRNISGYLEGLIIADLAPSSRSDEKESGNIQVNKN